jgi:hypothetical protein
MATSPLNTRTITGSTLVPPDGYVLSFSASDGYYIPRPPIQFLTISSPNTSPYTASTEDVVLVQSHVGTFTVNLPVGPPAGKTIYIKDFAGVSAANNIIVSSSAFIDGSSTFTINTNYSALRVIFNGSTWSILSKF